ncbi:MAG TPA: sugar transferase, partial [Flavitalea sp.]|nr:sugar transferase [Flavitalea sp.]
MQIETLPNVPQIDKKQYLRVATIASKTALCYFYIGTDPSSHDILSSSFHTGFTAEDINAAKKALKMIDQNEIDVLVIDVPYNEKELKDFQAFLRNRDLNLIPVIYNDCHFKNKEALSQNDLIDDIIDLCNFQYDFSSKITFLKKAKQYSFTTSLKKLRITPAKSISKRAFDVIVASLLLIMLLPLFILIALAIRLESKGPIFYNAKRAGRGFKIFRFFKFRTMEVNA